MNRAREPGAEPLDHAIGRSRGGLSTKIDQLVDGRGRPLVIALTRGQAGDSPMLKVLLGDLAVTRLGPGRPCTRRFNGGVDGWRGVCRDLFLVDQKRPAILERRRVGPTPTRSAPPRTPPELDPKARQLGGLRIRR